jgi:hypothetical protein
VEVALAFAKITTSVWPLMLIQVGRHLVPIVTALEAALDHISAFAAGPSVLGVLEG